MYGSSPPIIGYEPTQQHLRPIRNKPQENNICVTEQVLFCPKSACRVANRSTQTENTRHNMGFRVVFNVK
ncbi:hypothetical protein QIU19_13915 [Capnocytophaga canimorsus]|nr:hypothetical protein [Capnocytophaga canimorsus]WGU68327.1 hypothetical protein QIU19_13915 [Capnocytophaga canimorsus]